MTPHEPRPSERRYALSASTRHFVRHYAEMVVAMFAGMVVLGAPAGLVLRAMGTSWSALHTDAPALMLLVMAATMTVPMVGWMRYRGHGWQANAEMSASMVLPTVAVIALLWAGLVQDIGMLMLIEHVAMLLSMLAAMLLRRAEYSCGVHGAAGAEAVAA
jgi:flagellar biosynthetic protein FliP